MDLLMNEIPANSAMGRYVESLRRENDAEKREAIEGFLVTFLGTSLGRLILRGSRTRLARMWATALARL